VGTTSPQRHAQFRVDRVCAAHRRSRNARRRAAARRPAPRVGAGFKPAPTHYPRRRFRDFVGARRGPQKTHSVFWGSPHASPLFQHPAADRGRPIGSPLRRTLSPWPGLRAFAKPRRPGVMDTELVRKVGMPTFPRPERDGPGRNPRGNYVVDTTTAICCAKPTGRRCFPIFSLRCFFVRAVFLKAPCGWLNPLL
jgi:hypothetical protein